MRHPSQAFWFKFPDDPRAPIPDISVEEAMLRAMERIDRHVPTNPQTHKDKGTPL